MPAEAITRSGVLDEQAPWSHFEASLPIELARRIESVCDEMGLKPNEFLTGALDFYLRAYDVIKDGGSVEFVPPKGQGRAVTIDRLTNTDRP